MAKYKPYNYSQRVMIPVSLEDQLMPGTLEFAIRTLVEDRMDLSVFEDRYNNDETGLLRRRAKQAIADGIIYQRYIGNREDCSVR